MTTRSLFVGILRAYKRLVSPFMPPACRFHPTCSEYAAQAIEVHGALKGGALAAIRLLRCNPWSAGGIDPVPTRTHSAHPPRA
jgi:putative membrane protein insertion efficiency factor